MVIKPQIHHDLQIPLDTCIDLLTCINEYVYCVVNCPLQITSEEVVRMSGPGPRKILCAKKRKYGEMYVYFKCTPV